jgi:hypothetical protein
MRRKGDEGVWLVYGNNCWVGGPCSLYRREEAACFRTLARAVEDMDNLHEYLLNGEPAALPYIVEMAVLDERVSDETLLKCFACLPAVAGADSDEDIAERIWYQEAKKQLARRARRFSDGQALFAVLALQAAAEASHGKDDPEDFEKPEKDPYRPALRFAAMGANILRNKLRRPGCELLLEGLPPDGKCKEELVHLRNYLVSMLSPPEAPVRLDEELVAEVDNLIEQLGSGKWRDREAAHKRLERLLESGLGCCVLTALLEAHADCDAEQKYRIERLRSEAPGRSRMLSYYNEPLANLALLLRSDRDQRRTAAERLKDKLDIEEGLIDATLQERTKLVLEIVNKLQKEEGTGQDK